MANASNMNSIPQSVLTPEMPVSTELPGTPTTPVEQEAAPKVSEESKKIEDLSTRRFLHLSKKEAALLKKQEDFKKEQETFQKEQSEVAKYRKAWEMVNEIAELQKVDELAAMKKAGFSDTAIMNLMAQMENTDTTEQKAAKMARAEIDKFRSEQDAKEAKAVEQAEISKKAEEAKAVSNFKSDIGKEIKSSLDKYEYLNFYGDSAKDLVYDTINQVRAEEGEMISIAEAAELVEAFYEEQDKSMNSLKKRRSVEQPKNSEKPKPVEQPTISKTRVESKQYVNNRTPVKTLTNDLSVSSTGMIERTLSPWENKLRVIEKYRNSR